MPLHVADNDVAVVGAGIVGLSAARELAARGRSVVVLEQTAGEPVGSTAHAPGFIGLYNDAAVLTDLARESAQVYEAVGVGFTRRGGLELALSDEGAADLARRVDAARASGLRAALVAPDRLPGVVPEFVDLGPVVAAGLFEDDGVAEPYRLARAIEDDAVARGARVVRGEEVVAVEGEAPHLEVVTSSGARYVARDVVLAAGIWASALGVRACVELPVVPVAHPYVYSRDDARWSTGPFVRWPERHVYARAHGSRLGIGTYDHVPVPVAVEELAHGALLPWRPDFADAVEAAQTLLRPGARFVPGERLNGVFAMTPDNLPFLGASGRPGVWVAQAIWVTQAAGAAARLAAAICGQQSTPPELAVDRFDGMDPADLRERALGLYRDIYASEA